MRSIRHIILLLSLLSIGATRVALSQPHAFFRNSFVSLAAGPNSYFSSSGIAPGFGVDFTAGKWIVSTAAIRSQVSMQLADDSRHSLHPYWYGHVDICFDVITALKGRSHSRKLRSYALLGVGIVHSSRGDNDFCGIVGLGADYRISENWRFVTEMQSFLHPSDFDDNSRSSATTYLRLGVLRDIAYNPTRSRSSLESRFFANDWFFNIAFGSNYFRYSREEGDDNLNAMPVFEFALGKRLNYVWQIRLAASGLYASGGGERFSYYNLHGDMMFDLVSLFDSRRTSSSFTARPYVSAGLVTRLDDPSHFLFSPAVGGQLLFRPLRNHEVYLDMRYAITPPRFAHVGVSQGALSVGLATLMVGYSYTFSKNSFR